MTVWINLPYRHQPLRLAERQRLNQHRIDYAEHRACNADGNSHRQYRDKRDFEIPAEQAQPESKISQQSSHIITSFIQSKKVILIFDFDSFHIIKHGFDAPAAEVFGYCKPEFVVALFQGEI